MRVIFVGAHPDDIELGAGGTLIKHLKRGDRVLYVVLSRGEGGGNPEKRLHEVLEVVNSLGVESYRLFSFPDTRFHERFTEIKNAVEKLVEEFKPTRIYTHSLGDSHQDHKTTAEAVKIAGRRVPQILSFWSPLTYNNFHPVYFIDISDVIEEKMRILEVFKSQSGKDFMKRDVVKSVNRYFGFINSVEYAEGFEIIRVIEA